MNDQMTHEARLNFLDTLRPGDRVVAFNRPLSNYDRYPNAPQIYKITYITAKRTRFDAVAELRSGGEISFDRRSYIAPVTPEIEAQIEADTLFIRARARASNIEDMILALRRDFDNRMPRTRVQEFLDKSREFGDLLVDMGLDKV